MRRILHSVTTKKNHVTHFIKILISVFLIFSASILIISSVQAESSSYIPATPEGPDVGFLGIEYIYTIYTTSQDAQWMFDWGDGLYTAWLTVDEDSDAIIQTHCWSSKGIYQLRVKFKNNFFKEGVWSNPLPVTISQYESFDFPNPPQNIQGQSNVCINSTTWFTTSAVDPQENKVQIQFSWGDETFSDWTALVASAESVSVQKTWVKPGEYSITAQAKDQYGLVSDWSKPFTVTVDVDTDQDMLSDTREKQLGSDPKDPTDVEIIVIESTTHFIVTTQSGVKKFYNTLTEKTTTIAEIETGVYYIDVDDEGIWDYQYTASLSLLEQYVEPTQEQQRIEIPLIAIIIPAIIGGILLVIAALIKIGYIYIYDEYVPEE